MSLEAYQKSEKEEILLQAHSPVLDKPDKLGVCGHWELCCHLFFFFAPNSVITIFQYLKFLIIMCMCEVCLLS